MNRGTHYASRPGFAAVCNSWAVGPAVTDAGAVTCVHCLTLLRHRLLSQQVMSGDQDAGVWCGCDLVALGTFTSHRIHFDTPADPAQVCGTSLRETLTRFPGRAGWGSWSDHYTSDPARVTCLHCLGQVVRRGNLKPSDLPGNAVDFLRNWWTRENPDSLIPPVNALASWFRAGRPSRVEVGVAA